MSDESPAAPSDEPAHKSPHLAKSWGISLIIAAIALMVGRFWLLPLELEPRWLSGVISGSGGAMLFMAWSSLRKGADPLNWPMGVGAGLVAAFALLGGMFLMRPAALGDAPLIPFQHALFTLDAPDWGQPEGGEVGQQGRLEWMTPNRDAALNVSWSFGAGPTLDEATELIGGTLRGLGQVKSSRADPITGHQGPVDIAVLEVDNGMGAALSNIRCGDAFTLFVAVTARAGRSQALALHRRVARTVKCGEAGDAPPPLRPIWSAPEGFTEQWNDGDGWGHTRVGADGREETISFLPAQPDPSLAARVQKFPAARPGLIGMFVDGYQPLPSPPSRVIDGVERHFYAFSGTVPDDGTPIRGLLTVWPCSEAGATLFAVYLTVGGGSASEGAPLLAAARCPETP